MARVPLEPFDELYLANDDPWSFATSEYEQHKYRMTVGSLPHENYERCFEPGCSVGELTVLLADIADQVHAQDASPAAVARASARVADRPNVSVSVGTLPEQWPTGTFDLVVFSELGYYWDTDGLVQIVDRLADSLTAGGVLVAVHWLGTSSDHLLDGNTVHRILGERFGPPDLHHVETGPSQSESFVLDVWQCR